MYEQFKEILISELNVEPDAISLEAELTGDLGINSLELADLILICEDKLGVTIEDSQLSKFITVGDVVNYLNTLG